MLTWLTLAMLQLLFLHFKKLPAALHVIGGSQHATEFYTIYEVGPGSKSSYLDFLTSFFYASKNFSTPPCPGQIYILYDQSCLHVDVVSNSACKSQLVRALP